jgi:hypothetical protein
MKLSTEIKQYFKTIGIPVSVNTVAVKHPFVQVWIKSEPYTNHREPLRYNYEFPVALRQKLLVIIYGSNFVAQQKAVGCSDSAAGNIRAHSLSVTENEWRQLMQDIERAEAYLDHGHLHT